MYLCQESNKFKRKSPLNNEKIFFSGAHWTLIRVALRGIDLVVFLCARQLESRIQPPPPPPQFQENDADDEQESDPEETVTKTTKASGMAGNGNRQYTSYT